MRKVIALVSSLLLVATFASPAQSEGAKYSVYQKTLAAFGSSATTLTTQQEAQVKASVEANPTAEKFICTGIRYYDQPMSVNITVRKRAKAACEYAKQLNPALSTWYQNKPTQARSYAGKVLLTVKSPDTESKYVIARAAYESARVVVDGSTTAPANSILASDNLPKEYEGMILKNLSTAMSMWDERYGVIEPYTVIAFTHEDGAWADEQARTHRISLPVASWSVWIANYAESSGENCGLATAGSNNYFMCMALDPKAALQQSTKGAHEYFHSIQKKIGLNHQNIPVWIGEGAPTYFEAVAGDLGYKATSEKYGNFSTWGFYERFDGSIQQAVSRMTNADILEVYRSLEIGMIAESISVMDKYAGYAMGALATEYLIGVHGYETFMDFQDSVGKGAYWKTAFYDYFDVTPDEFYVDVLDYLKTVY
ncbi:hypothetical protein [Candidatus Aquiluna sp. IMCC13023]|uniref:hypothetical protein n=1 Tax=Candidatus Aquiluna sp. IMCC13023 TaxID=1081644 RepID=UPI0002F34628|nr:hypothetical protein [Candidatus Aquiluna sp. IMCC13023]